MDRKSSFEGFEKRENKIGLVGLGYVGLPLAHLLSSKYEVVAFDINRSRIEELRDGIDKTKEIGEEELKNSTIRFTDNPDELKECGLIIVTVPTPITESKVPDLSYIEKASETVSRVMGKGCIVVYESTVYPGVTEEICVPILEKGSGLKWKEDFNVGYSPERVNPGDKNHTIDKIIKVVAGDSEYCSELLSKIYGSVVTAGIHLARNIKTAEAAKVIENTQRDLNIALMNELAIIFNELGINTLEVIEAASTKWNFLKFYPGLVGGHCIGVDPYYLTYKAEEVGYHPQVILSGRKINDRMGKYIAEQTVKSILKAGKNIHDSRVLIAGMTFKENITDIRNTKVTDIYEELREYGVKPVVYDPWVDEKEVREEYGIEAHNRLPAHEIFSAVIMAVPHKVFEKELSFKQCLALQKSSPVIIDVKGVFKEESGNNECVYFGL